MGRPKTTGAFPVGMHDAGTVLALAARLELASEHPLGRTIVDEARERGLEIGVAPTEVEVIKGVEQSTAAAGHAVAREQAGNTAGFAVVDGELAGVISIADSIRPEARDAISAMRRRGVKKFYMLTGHNRHTVAMVGDGINDAPPLPRPMLAWPWAPAPTSRSRRRM